METRGSKRRRQAACEAYAGWVPAPGDETVERVEAHSLSPLAFFERFVARRRPVLLVGGLYDASYAAPCLWTDSYLRQRAGNATVRVERRPSSNAAFGAHVHEEVRMGAFMDALAAGEERLYLTTEASRFDQHGRLQVLSSPLPLLLGDLPLRPSLAGNLVTAAVNAWLGRSKQGATSGLHHDWHDNLYSLLRGHKRFELYPPCETQRLYPFGRLRRVHPNGRINYSNAPSRADGADAADVERVARLDLELAELELASAQAAGARARMLRAEAQVENALAAALDAEAASLGSDDSGVEEDAQGADSDDAPPPHFSRCLGRQQALASPDAWPLFAEARMLSVDVQEGDALYLPCGWWHEVSSRGADASDTHLAVNWWFAPPDTANFEAPYSSDLWERDWAHWIRDVLPSIQTGTAE